MLSRRDTLAYAALNYGDGKVEVTPVGMSDAEEYERYISQAGMTDMSHDETGIYDDFTAAGFGPDFIHSDPGQQPH